MNRFWNVAVSTLFAFAAAAPLYAQAPWIHVDVSEDGEDGTHVKVNLPLSVVQIALEAAPDEFVSDGQHPPRPRRRRPRHRGHAPDVERAP